MADELRELRLSKSIPAKDMVDIVRTLYPKYDKTMQSKCENGETYGVELRQDAMDALYTKFAPEIKETAQRRRKDRHRLTCRISARLENELFQVLQKRMEADGYATAQEWITVMAKLYTQGEISMAPHNISDYPIIQNMERTSSPDGKKSDSHATLSAAEGGE